MNPIYEEWIKERATNEGLSNEEVLNKVLKLGIESYIQYYDDQTIEIKGN